jgi:hypothetical protein
MVEKVFVEYIVKKLLGIFVSGIMELLPCFQSSSTPMSMQQHQS